MARVEIRLKDGTRHEVRPVDGYLVLDYLAELPAGLSKAQREGFDPLQGITFFDKTGKAIAAQTMDGSGTGEDHEVVDGLPPLGKYPSRRGSTIY